MPRRRILTRQPMQVIKAQPGAQTAFLECPADIMIFGGSAFGSKTFSLLMDVGNLCRRYKNYGAVIFRRTCVQVKSQGGLWDTSETIYSLIGGVGARGSMRWEFPETGSTVTFAHMEHEKNRLDWQGAQIPYIGFDELTHFTEAQFVYMLSRNRSDSTGPTLIRATCNPDPDHFIAKWIEWWIDPITGYAIPERSGVIRWFCRVGNEMWWADKASELKAKFGAHVEPKSFTFIRSSIEDNPIGVSNNPQYIANLMALPTVEREQLRYGNWLIRPSAGMYFKRHQFGSPVADYPKGYRTVRFWDRAATVPSETNKDPDWTVGLKMTKTPEGLYYVIDMVRDRLTPAGVEALIKQTAAIDGYDVEIHFGQDPASAGKMEADYFVRMLAGYSVTPWPMHKDKETMAKPVSSQVAGGNVLLVEGDWNEALLNECSNFPMGAHDDACVARGTMIYTSSGERPVESVKAGEFVWTRSGLHKVLWSGMTNPSAELLRIEAEGRSLYATGNHPIFTDKGFICLDALPGTCIVTTCKSNSQNSTVEPTAATQNQKTETTGSISSSTIHGKSPSDTCTVTSGNQFTEKFRKVFTSIIRMATRLIILSKIWSVSLKKNIVESMPEEETVQLKKYSTISIESGPLQKRGTLLQKAARGTECTQGRSQTICLNTNANALNVGMTSLQKSQAVQNTVQIRVPIKRDMTAKNLQYSEIARCAKKILEQAPRIQQCVAQKGVRQTFVGPVYNLHVEGEHEYFANGILVHNCDCLSGAFAVLALGPLDLSRDGIATGHSRLGAGRSVFKARRL